MSYILWVEIEGFYVDHHESEGRPLIVGRDKKVLDANLLAKKHGARIGMEVRQAKAVVSDCRIENWEPEPYLPRRNAWLDVCTEFTGVIEPIDQHIAALDLTAHPNPFDVTERLVRELVRQTRLNVRYAAAPSVWIAQVAAENEDLGRAIEAPERFLAPLPVKHLIPASIEARNRLAFLGYRTIGDVSKLPLATLQAQFGEEALVIQASVQGRHFLPAHALYPQDSLRDCLLFDGAVEVWESIDLGLKTLADRIGRRLSERGMQSSQLAMKVETEEGLLTKERRFTKPIGNPLTAHIAMRLLIQDEIASPVLGIHVTLTDLEKTRHRQDEIVGFTLRSKRTDPASAIGYVRTVFGDQSVRLGSQIEVPRRVRVLKEWQNATGWR
ncbi:MAG: hypothetical protein P4L46_17260 [Fimbriimonas sp.]|nr:hypothetical protein [Fimbriimonas sp.]